MDTSSMTVGKLIEVLQKFNQEAPVAFQGLDTYDALGTEEQKFVQITEKYLADGSTEVVIGVKP